MIGDEEDIERCVDCNEFVDECICALENNYDDEYSNYDGYDGEEYGPYDGEVYDGEEYE